MEEEYVSQLLNDITEDLININKTHTVVLDKYKKLLVELLGEDIDTTCIINHLKTTTNLEEND